MAIKRRERIEWTPTRFSTAEDKQKFYDHCIKFIENGFKRTQFPQWFYSRLSNCFGHIANYDIDDFYSVWFSHPTRQSEWLRFIEKRRVVGDPEYTYSDVERKLQEWIIIHKPADPIQAEIDREIEKTEREMLARLIAKYGVPDAS